MTESLIGVLSGRDPSAPVAVAALLRVADGDGATTFGQLAVAYREDHLVLYRDVLGETSERAGTLSVDEVRRYLRLSVLPRLVTDGVLDPVPDVLEDDSPVGLRAAHWAAVAPAGTAVRERLLSAATDALHAAETRPERAARTGGSTLAGRGLTKVYRRRRVVDHVDVEVRQGEIVGLLGPNGAGKTTTFYMIVGLIRPDAGRVHIDETDITGFPMYERARRGIGYLAQEPSVFRKLTVEENVMAILEMQDLDAAARKHRLEGLLDELAIKHLRDVPAYKLSGGERRRLEITRALVTDPRFMLLDEPFAGVDPIATHDIQTIVAGLRHRGIGVLITDHNVEQTLDIVDRAYIVFEGKIQVAGSVRDLVFDDRVADLYFGPTLTARLRDRLGNAA